MNKFFLLITCIVFSASTIANGFEVNGVYYWITNDTIQPYSVEVRRPEYGFYNAEKVEIPSSIVYSGNTYIVTSIHGLAFLGASITTLTIPSSVTRVSGIVDGIRADNIVVHAITPPDVYYCSSQYEMRNKTLYVPKESLHNYAQAEGWKAFPRIMPIGGSEKDCIYHLLYDPKNKVESVAGCKFNTECNDAIYFFNNKYGRYYEKDSHTATYTDINFAGQTLDFMILYFKHNDKSNRNEFCSIEFQKVFKLDEYERAKMCYEYFKEIYSDKYSNGFESNFEEYGYWCGMINHDYDDSVPPIHLSLTKSTSRGGDEHYYLIIEYYSLNTENLYKDDI